MATPSSAAPTSGTPSTASTSPAARAAYAPSVPVALAWEPLPRAEFDEAAARHLLRRVGWTARPSDAQAAVRDGLPATLDRLFPTQPTSMTKPALVGRFEEQIQDFNEKRRDAPDADAKRMVQRQEREFAQLVARDLTLKWLAMAADPAASAREKWLLCLSDVYVVAMQKVRQPALIYRHQEILRAHSLGPAPELSKAVSRSPAMIMYLDLQQSKKGEPNENFARELFELFMLGEGHYTEKDIKESARAFTGYRQARGNFVFAERQHDDGRKSLFGESGNFNGDDVIDLAYKQPAASTFLPGEMLRFYVSDQRLPQPYLDALGEWWRGTGFDMRALLLRVFQSRLFFAPELRGTMIKSPMQFYLGLVQDLDLQVAPLQRTTLNPLRFMGQEPLDPPNVRGWVGGRTWIHSGTLAARRGLVQALFSPLPEDKLNADELVELVAARADGETRFTVDDDRMSTFAAQSDDAVISRLVDYFLPIPVAPAFRDDLRSVLADAGSSPDARRQVVRSTTMTVLESAEYQLC